MKFELGGAPNKRRTDPKKETIKNYFVYTEETIYAMKMINDFYLKFVNPVARQVRTPRFDRTTRTS